MVIRDAFVAVLSEFKNTFPTPVETSKPVDSFSYVAQCTREKKLRAESQVYYLLQGLHGIVYVHSNRTHKGGRPVFGKVYSNFLFDAYRRSFTFGGTASLVAQAWQDAREDATRKAFDAAIAELQDASLVTSYRQRLAARIADSREEMAPVRAALTAALDARCGKHYPNIDLFLREIVDALTLAWPRREGEGIADARQYACELVNDAFKIITHGNSVSRNAPREAWLMDAPESWRVKRDHSAGLMFENLKRKGDPFFYGYEDVLPKADGFAAPAGVSDRRKKWVRRLLTPAPQKLAHEAVREAAQQCLLAKWYFDERLQRNVAIDAEALGRKLLDADRARSVHDDAARQRAIVALQMPIVVRGEALQKSLQRARQGQVENMRTRQTFPVFADVPWRVTRREGLKIAKHHFAFFSTMPFLRGKHIGNCNSIAFAFLELAVRAQARLTGEQEEALNGRWKVRAIGSRHTLRLPVPQVRRARTPFVQRMRRKRTR